MRKALVTFIFIFLIGSVQAQSERSFVWESGVFLSYKPLESWKFNTSVVQRTTRLSELNGRSWEASYLEINQIINRKINPWINVALGYKYRSTDPVNELSKYEHRITQQLGWTHFEQRARLVSRFRLEQRIRDDAFAQRYRYRLSVDMPLSGENLDPKEFYLVLSNEIMLQTERNENQSWSDRIGGSIGYLLSKKMRLELSFIHRVEDFNSSTEHTPFFHSNLLISL